MRKYFSKSILLFVFFNIFGTVLLAQKQVTESKKYLSENADKQNLSATDINEMKVSSEYLSPTTGWYHIYFNQMFHNVEVFNNILSVTLKNDKVAFVANNFVQSINKISTATSANYTLSPEDAVLKAVSAINVANTNIGTLKKISSTNLPNGKLSAVKFENENLSSEKITAKLYWYLLEKMEGDKSISTIKLIWCVSYLTLDNKNSWSIKVDANTGEILQKIDEIIHCNFGTPGHSHNEVACTKNTISENVLSKNSFSPTANGYNVFDYPLESPIHGSRTLVTYPYTRFLPAGAGPGTTNGWHNDGTVDYTNTRGNNVWSKDDIANDNETTIGTSPSSATLDFNYPYTQATASAASNLNAATTNLFYWNNVIHDVLWRYGFDEPSGNFQNNNGGKGGAGGDYVLADAQDGGGVDNANFSTPVDGGRGRMQMYLWSNAGSPQYQPDGDFDNGIIAHEYGHGWSIRLSGGPANSSCLQNTEQGGEGWADYNGLMLCTNWAALTPSLASANIPRGIGTYAIGEATNGAGIRPYRYSYDKANINNPVTYGKVANASSFSAPHGIGSIWATILWDMTWEIILQDNMIIPNIYDVPTNILDMRGNVAALKLVNEGLRLQACSPSFIQARDAIFQADAMLFNGRYYCAIGKAFARRGVGLLASTGASSNDRIITEDFTPFPGPPLTSPINNTSCSGQAFNYTATVGVAGAYTFSWTRATVVGVSNTSGSGSNAIVNEILINTTSNPVNVKYLFTVSPDLCGGTPLAQTVNVTVNPTIIPTVSMYSICQNQTVPVGQGLVVPSTFNNNINDALIVGATYNRGSGTTTYTAATAPNGSSVYFKFYTFVAQSTAAVTFSTTVAALTPGTSDDTYLAIYQTSFNPATPATNFLRGDDDSGPGALSSLTQNLTIGQTYVLVVSTYSNSNTGTFSLLASANGFEGINSWYLNASGGSPLATGNIFNPVGVAGSGIANTATPGTSLFYVSDAAYPDCRTVVSFTILSPVLYVNANATGANNGTSWINAYTTLPPAIAGANSCSGSQIWVAEGAYKPTITSDREISFSMKNGVSILGGFSNVGNPTLVQRNPTLYKTILSGDIGLAGNADNSYHVINNPVTINNTAILDGFIVTDGNANTAGSFRNVGAGIFNNAGGAGGVCSPQIINCILRNNIATDGAAIYNNAAGATTNPIFTNCIFESNTANNGAVIYNNGTASGNAGTTFTNCSFANNTSTVDGGVAYNSCTGGTCNDNYKNCIFWNNGGVKTFLNANATNSIIYSLLENAVTNYSGTIGNIFSNVSPFILNTDLHLNDASLAIDAGTITGAPLLDIDFASRSTVPDMGAYENKQACIGVNKIFYSNITGTTYQWQKDDGSGYVDIATGSLYNNVTTNKLTVISPANTVTGTKFRCKVNNGSIVYSSEITLRFYSRWIGTVDNNWQNTANWGCGTLPNQYTDVIIPSSKTIYPLVNISGSIRTLQTETGSNISIAPSINLTIVGQ